MRAGANFGVHRRLSVLTLYYKMSENTIMSIQCSMPIACVVGAAKPKRNPTTGHWKVPEPNTRACRGSGGRGQEEGQGRIAQEQNLGEIHGHERLPLDLPLLRAPGLPSARSLSEQDEVTVHQRVAVLVRSHRHDPIPLQARGILVLGVIGSQSLMYGLDIHPAVMRTHTGHTEVLQGMQPQRVSQHLPHLSPAILAHQRLLRLRPSLMAAPISVLAATRPLAHRLPLRDGRIDMLCVPLNHTRDLVHVTDPVVCQLRCPPRQQQVSYRINQRDSVERNYCTRSELQQDDMVACYHNTGTHACTHMHTQMRDS